jgi:hypothetical protein
MSMAARCIARSTSSGIVVGPGTAMISRPARTTIALVPSLSPGARAGTLVQCALLGNGGAAASPKAFGAFDRKIKPRLKSLIPRAAPRR